MSKIKKPKNFYYGVSDNIATTFEAMIDVKREAASLMIEILEKTIKQSSFTDLHRMLEHSSPPRHDRELFCDIYLCILLSLSNTNLTKNQRKIIAETVESRKHMLMENDLPTMFLMGLKDKQKLRELLKK